MKKIWILLCLSLAFIVSANGTKDLATTEEGPIEGVLTYMEGDVWVNDAFAEFGMIVPADGRIKTGVDGYCEIQFLGKNIFRLQEDSILQLQLKSSGSSLNLQQGTMAALFDKLDRLTGEDPLQFITHYRPPRREFVEPLFL
jgi:hypothetical protein